MSHAKHKAPSGPTGSKLPKEAVKFAKSMGLDLSGLEPEAEEMWKMLDDMSRNDPAGYESFVAQQLKEGKEVNPQEPTGRSLRPDAGFCVQTTTIGGDGIKVRDANDKTGKKLYINLCSTDVIEQPRDKDGKVMLEKRYSADGLSIPLLIGQKRDVDDNTAIAIDVLMHPSVIDAAKAEKLFKSQLLELAFDWVSDEAQIVFIKDKFTEASQAYCGGRGENKATPVLFMVDPSMCGEDPKKGGSSAASCGSNNKKSSGDVLSSTSSLLSQIQQQDKALEQVGQEKMLNISGKSNNGKNGESQAPGGSIPGLSSSSSGGPVDITGLALKAAKEGVASKKEENVKKSPLVQEIAADGTAVAPVKLADNTDDTSTTNAAIESKASSDHAGSGLDIKEVASINKKTKEPITKSSITSKAVEAKTKAEQQAAFAKAISNPNSKALGSGVSSSSSSSKNVPSKREFEQMQALMEGFDDELTPALGAFDKSYQDPDEAILANMAKLLSGPGGGMGGLGDMMRGGGGVDMSSLMPPNVKEALAVHQQEQQQQQADIAPPLVSAPKKSTPAPAVSSLSSSDFAVTNSSSTINFSINVISSGSPQVVTATLTGLPTTLSASAIDLQVSKSDIKVSLSHEGVSTILTAKCVKRNVKLLADQASASFKRKKGTMTFTIEYQYQ